MLRVLGVAAMASSLALSARAQDPATTAMAMGMVSQFGGAALKKLETEMDESSKNTPMPCIGPHCCRQSSCFNVPGMGCHKGRGPTRCIGSRSFPPITGTCACLVGACSPQGMCSSDGLPQTFEPAPAPPPMAAAAPSGGWYTEAAAASPSSGVSDEFNSWQPVTRSWTPVTQLYSDEHRVVIAEGTIPREDHTAALLALGVATFAAFAVFVGFAVKSALGVVRRRRAAGLLVPSEEDVLELAATSPPLLQG